MKKILAFIGWCFLNSSLHAQSCTPPPSGLVSWWPGDGNANDIVGNNNGTLVGGVGFTNGEVGQAFSFNGSDYVSIPDSPSLDSLVSRITIEGWIQVPQGSGANWNTAFGKGNAWNLRRYAGTTVMSFTTIGMIGSDSAPDLEGTKSINDGQWHHVAGVYDGTNKFLYVDGTLDASAPATGQLAQSSEPIYIGANTDQAPYTWTGLVDAVSVYNHALTASEIQAIYNAGSAGKCLPVPVITSQPTSESVVEGAATSLTITATGLAPLTYQWLFDGTNIFGATNTTLTFANAQITNAGVYSVVVSNNFASINSTSAVLQVLLPGSPSIQVNGQLAVGTMPCIVSGQATISGGFPNGFIFYTLDGTIPSLNSQFYSGPFTLTNTAIVQAISYTADLSQSSQAPPVEVQVIPVYTLGTSWTGPRYTGLGTSFITVYPYFGYNGNGPSSSGPNASYGPYTNNTVVMVHADSAGASGWGQTWGFDHWAGDAAGNQNPLSLTMNETKNVQAVFKPTSCNILLNFDGNYGGGDPINIGITYISATTLGGGTVTLNGMIINPAVLNPDGGWWDGWFCPTSCVVTVTGVASNGWEFLNWQGDPNNTNNPFTGPAGNYIGTFGTITATNTAGGGRIVLSYPNPTPYGAVTASAVPNDGNYFLTWSGAATGTTNPTVVPVTTPTPTITALFTALPAGKLSLSPVVVGNGSVTISPQQKYYNPGDTVTLTATGSNFYGWTGDASGTNNSLIIIMNVSKIVQANFIPLPTVTVNISPQNPIVFGGSNAVLYANASGQPPLTYQWQDSDGIIAGATNAAYTIFDAQATNTDSYSVIVSNPSGSVTSAVATVTVVFPPSISLQPSNQTIAVGSSLILAVTANGTTPLNFQWQNSSGSISGQTNSSLVLSPALTNYTANYSVVVSNPYGAATSQVATVFVYLPVGISSQPASLIVPYSAPATFGVTASGFPSPSSYQWMFNGTNLPGATANTLTINSVRLSNTGLYQVQVGNGYSSTTSHIATLNISPSITSPFSGATTIWGTSANISVVAIGTGTLGYQWYYNGVAISGATSPTLDFTTIQFTNAGLYSVVVSSAYGSVTNAAAQLIVNPAGVSLGFYPGLTLTGVAGYSYIIQSSTDLSNTNDWITLTNLSLIQPEELWIDTSVDATSPFNSKVFYRVLPGQ